MIANVKKDMLKKNIPTHWQGGQLRLFIAEHYAKCVIKGVLTNRQKRAYNNEVLVNNLI